jgi:EcoEI R protein
MESITSNGSYLATLLATGRGDLVLVARLTQRFKREASFDLLCHVAFNAPLRTRRAETLRLEKEDFFAKYGPEARAVLTEMLEKYVEYGTAQFQIPELLKVPPISERGTVPQIAAFFGKAEQMRTFPYHKRIGKSAVSVITG